MTQCPFFFSSFTSDHLGNVIKFSKKKKMSKNYDSVAATYNFMKKKDHTHIHTYIEMSTYQSSLSLKFCEESFEN